MKDHATHHDGCACFRKRVLDEVVESIKKAMPTKRKLVDKAVDRQEYAVAAELFAELDGLYEAEEIVRNMQ